MMVIQSRYPVLLLLGVLGMPNTVQALTCQLDNFSSPNIGNVTLKTINSASTDQLLSYSCTNNSETTQWVSVCLGADGGANNPMQISPRHLTGPANSIVNFTMTLSDKGHAIWGTGNTGTEFIDFIAVPSGETTTRTTAIKVSLSADNSLAVAGNYTAHFTGANSALRFVTSDSSSDRQQCSSESQGTVAIPFTVKATLLASCYIKDTDAISLGEYPANLTNITGFNSQAISLMCTNGSYYNIGLIPSNNNQKGAGVMKSTLDSSSEVAYQLQSTAGMGGEPWGNMKDNWVTRLGSGRLQTETVYITVPNIDVKADEYTDVVTVKIYY